MTDYDDGVSRGSYSYNALGRKIGESVDYGPFTLTSSYDYYKNGLKKSYTGPDGAEYVYSYDAGNRLAGVAIPGQGLVTFNTYQWNRPTKITLPGGATKGYSYDGLMRLTGIVMQDPAGAALMDYAYSHDRTGNITANRTEHGDYAYDYDVLSRLTSATGPVAPAEAYSYDAVGNRLTADGVINEFVYNANNELTSAADLGLAFSYDANGNTVARLHDGAVVQRYGYDADNQLTSVRDGAEAVVAGYGYDPFGRRLWKEVGGTRTNFFYSDEGLVGEYGADGTEQKVYGWLPGSTWSTDPLFMAEGGQFYWYLSDHLGTPRKLINSNGLVVWSADYDSFGKAEVDAGSVVVNNLRFPGQYWDEETGLHYNWHRYYDPATGRYLAVDPIGLAGGINLYGYVQNNPENFVDPWGLHGSSGMTPGTPTVTSCHNSETNPMITLGATGTIGTFDSDGIGHSTDLLGASVDITFGNEGQFEVVIGISRREGLGFHFSGDGSIIGVSVHIGQSVTKSPITFTVKESSGGNN